MTDCVAPPRVSGAGVCGGEFAFLASSSKASSAAGRDHVVRSELPAAPRLRGVSGLHHRCKWKSVDMIWKQC